MDVRRNEPTWNTGELKYWVNTQGALANYGPSPQPTTVIDCYGHAYHYTS